MATLLLNGYPASQVGWSDARPSARLLLGNRGLHGLDGTMEKAPVRIRSAVSRGVVRC